MLQILKYQLEKCGLLAYSPLAGGRLSGKYIGNKKQLMQDIQFGQDGLVDIIQKEVK